MRLKAQIFLNLRLEMVIGFALFIFSLAAHSGSSCILPHALTRHVHIVVYDAGETFGLLPVVSILRKQRIEVIWLPLTPWAQNILEREG